MMSSGDRFSKMWINASKQRVLKVGRGRKLWVVVMTGWKKYGEDIVERQAKIQINEKSYLC